MDTNVPIETSEVPVQSSRKNTFLIAGGVAIIIVVLFCAVFLLSSNKKNQTANVATPTPVPVDNKKIVAQKAPKVYFETYENEAVVPSKTAAAYYTLKSNFSTEEVTQFAKKLGLDTYNGTGEMVNAYTFTNASSLGVMAFNKTTGTFDYRAYGDKKPVKYTVGQSPVTSAQQILTDIGIFDDTISCPVTYQQKGAPESITFVECHRDWQKIGLPVVNLVGVINLPETKKLVDLTVGKTDELTPRDSTITNVSTGENGKARPSDFNTITVGVKKDGSIFSIKSNMRIIAERKTITSSELITPTEALETLSKHTSQFSLTIPAGGGGVDWKKVYPQNTAQAKSATIQEIVLVYPDKTMQLPLASYEPTYLMRGIAQLASGFTVRFVQAVPARRSQLTVLHPQTRTQVAGMSTHIAQNQININSFTPQTHQPTNTPIPTTVVQPTGTPVPPTPTVQPTNVPTQPPLPTPTPSDYTCLAANAFPYAGTMTLILEDGSQVVITGGSASIHTFFLVSSPTQNPDMEQIRNALFDVIAQQYAGNVAQFLLSEGQEAPRSVEGVKAVYNRMSRSEPGNCADMKSLAPLTNCLQGVSSGETNLGLSYYNYNFAAAQRIADKTAEIVLSNSNSLSSLASHSYGDQSLHWGLLSWGDAAGQQSAACYISGVSPVVFFSTDRQISFSASTAAPITYTDPQITANHWSGTLNADGSIVVNNQKRDSVYYEYDKKTLLSGEKSGFVVERSQLIPFVEQTISTRLGLTKKEALALVKEVQAALVGEAEAPYIKLSLAPQQELDQKLPLTISPQPQHIYRIHLLLTPLYQDEFIVPQIITPIIRNGFTVVELGARLN